MSKGTCGIVQVEVDSRESVGQLKEKIRERTDIPAEQLHIVHKGQHLPDHTNLASANINGRLIVHMIPLLNRPTPISPPNDVGCGQKRVQVAIERNPQQFAFLGNY